MIPVELISFIVILAVVAGSFMAGLLFFRLRLPSEGHPYQPAPSVLTSEEHHFLEVLQEALRPEYIVYPKLRLASIMRPARGIFYRLRDNIFSNLGVDHVDFAICDPHELRVAGVIELDHDGAPHRFTWEGVRQHFYESALETAQIPLMRFDARSQYVQSTLRQQVLATLVPEAEPSPSQVKVGLVDEKVWIFVEGRGTFQNSTGLRKVGQEMMRRSLKNFTIDLSACELLDSTFLGTLAELAFQTREVDGHVGFINANPRSLNRLSSFGLHDILIKEGPSTKAPEGTTSTTLGNDHSRSEKRETLIQAHEALVKSSPENAIIYRDALDFLQGEGVSEET